MDDGLPYFEHSIFYVNRYYDADILLSGNDIVEIQNKSGERSPSNRTEINKPIDDNIGKTMEFVQNTLLECDDIFIEKGKCTITIVLECIAPVVVNYSLYFSKPVAHSGSRVLGFKLRDLGQNYSFDGCYPGVATVVYSSGSRPTNAFTGKTIISFVSDSANGGFFAKWNNENLAGVAEHQVLSPSLPELINIDRVELVGGDPSIKLRAVDIKNRVLTEGEVLEVQNYFANQYGITPQ